MYGFEVSRNNILRRKIKSLLKLARRNFWDIDVKYWQFVYDSSGSMGKSKLAICYTYALQPVFE